MGMFTVNNRANASGVGRHVVHNRPLAIPSLGTLSLDRRMEHAIHRLVRINDVRRLLPL